MRRHLRRGERCAAGTAQLGLLATVLVIEGCAPHRPPATAPAPAAAAFVATAYCHTGITAAGVRVRPGMVAADPAVLPLGATIRIARSGRFDGVYKVMDTGPKVQGRHVDLFIENCAAARRFGRRTVRVSLVGAAHER